MFFPVTDLHFGVLFLSVESMIWIYCWHLTEAIKTRTNHTAPAVFLANKEQAVLLLSSVHKHIACLCDSLRHAHQDRQVGVCAWPQIKNLYRHTGISMATGRAGRFSALM